MQILKRNPNMGRWEIVHRLRNRNEFKCRPKTKWYHYLTRLAPELLTEMSEDEWIARAILLAKSMNAQRVEYYDTICIGDEDMYRRTTIWDYAEEQKYIPKI